jgi:hypothetical protein
MTQLSEQLKSAESKLAAFLKSAKIHPTRLLVTSKELESLRPEDRAIKRAKKAAVGKEDDAAKAARAKKPRSGRPVTERALRAAIAGSPISGPAKQRILRAVNAIQTHRKAAEADLKKLF